MRLTQEEIEAVEDAEILIEIRDGRSDRANGIFTHSGERSLEKLLENE